MPTIHEQIDEFLAADLHGELSTAEQNALHAHLIECAQCRKDFQEEKNMHKLLNETMSDQKADPAFEQRMIARFRNRVPQRTGLIGLLSNLMRFRAVQITAAAAVLLALAQMGRMITGEKGSTLPVTVYSADSLKESKNEPVEAIRQLPSFVGNAETENDSKGPSEPAPAPPSLSLDKSSARTVSAPKTKKADLKDEEARAVTTSAIENTSATSPEATPGPMANRKLVRNATAELEVVSFEDAVQKITGFASEDKGYVATTSSEKQANGKLRGEIVVKVLPDNLDRFLGKLRGLGELKNQALTTEDVTKQYFDTESRLKNARLMEQRLIEILKTKSKDVSDLLEVEKELGRVREEIETMQGELKFMDSQVANSSTPRVRLSSGVRLLCMVREIYSLRSDGVGASPVIIRPICASASRSAAAAVI